MTADIRFNGSAGPLYVAAGTVINLANFSDAGVLGWEWTIMDRPTGSGAVIGSAFSDVTSFTADVDGSYLVRLRTYTDALRTIIDDSDREIVAVRMLGIYDWRKPAAGERDEVDSTRGWATAIDEIVDDLSAFLTSAGTAFLLGDGTQAAPGLAFTLDPNLGLWRIGADTMGISAGNVEVVRFKGVAAAAPQALFATGATLVPAISFSAAPTVGFNYNGSGGITVATSGGFAWNFNGANLHPNLNNATIGPQVAGNTWGLTSYITTAGSLPGITVTNSVAFTGAGGAANQIGMRLFYTINQTLTAGFSALSIDLQNTALGSNPQYFLNLLVSSTTVAGIKNGGTAATRGTFMAADGNTSQPAYALTSSPNSGFFSSVLHQLDFVSAGSSAMRFASTGITLLNASQAVLSASAANVQFIIQGNQTTGTSDPGMYLRNSSSFTAASGTQRTIALTSTVNQTSTAGFTALDIRITETAVGSGAQSIIDAYTGAAGTTQVFRVTNTGRMFASGGTSASPSIAFVGDTTSGFTNNGASGFWIVCAGVGRWQFNSQDLSALTSGSSIGTAVVDGSFVINGRASVGVTPSVVFAQVGAIAFTASTAIVQRGLRLQYIVNQTSTAGFTTLELSTTETALGSGTQYAINVMTGGAGATRVFTVTNAGRVHAGNGTLALPAYSFVSSTSGLYHAGSEVVGMSIAGTYATQSWSVTGTSAGPTHAMSNGNLAFTSSNTVQRLLTLSVTLNQTSTAGSSIVQIGTTNTALGSGAHYFLDCQVSGSIVAGITNSATAALRGRVLAGQGTTALPSLSFLAEPGTGLFYDNAVDADLGFCNQGTQMLRLTAASSSFHPMPDNNVSLGGAIFRWSNLYATKAWFGPTATEPITIEHYTASPTGVISAFTGSIVGVSDPTLPVNDGLWVKNSGDGTNTGWEQISGDKHVRRVRGIDDFDRGDSQFWELTQTSGATITYSGANPAADWPVSGLYALNVTATAGSRCAMLRSLTGMKRFQNPIIEWHVVPSAGELDWMVGIADADIGVGANNGIVLYADYNTVANTYSYYLGIVVAGAPTLTAVTMPALGGEVTYRVRLRVTATGFALDAAAGDGPYTEIGTSTTDPPDVVYVPYANASKEDNTGNTTLYVDYVAWDMARFG